MEKLKVIILSVLLVGTLSSCSNSDQVKTHGMLVPHHLLVEGFIDDIYEQVSQENSYERVIIVSPNHFNYGYSFIQTADELPGDLQIDLEFMEGIIAEKALFLEPTYFKKEHGITVQLDFIDEFFPSAKVVPIIIKKSTPPARLDYLVETLLEMDLKNTLIIASIDFTHFEAEEFAKLDDKRTTDWMKKWSLGDEELEYEKIIELSFASEQDREEAVAMDSPESLYVLLGLMDGLNSNDFTLVNRTSTGSLTSLTDAADNTSHIFGIFSSSI